MNAPDKFLENITQDTVKFKLNGKEISNGINEIKKSFKKNIKFLDILICLRYTKY